MKTRKETVQRLMKLLGVFTMDYLSDLENIENEKKLCAEAEQTGEPKIIVLTGEQNAKVMLNCMKEIRKAVKFLNDDENEVDNWQLAGINAMFDTVNETKEIPYDLPYAVCGILGTDF
jgi:hypothetical protein